MNIFGFRVEVVFLKRKEVLAYAWHYSEEKARNHLRKIAEYHGIDGRPIKSAALEKWLEKEIEKVVIRGKSFVLPPFEYKNRAAYEKVIEIPKGKTSTYSQIAKASGIKYHEFLISLMRNPFQILIPCHRLLTNSGSLMGFYPLGKEVKRKILEIEGVKIE